MKLYTYFRSSASYRVRIALNVKGLAFESAAVHLRQAQHRTPEYRAVNVQGLVPALVDGSSQAIPQSLAILEYLEEKYPDPPLLPARAEERAQVRALALAVACDMHPLNNLRVLEYLKGTVGQGEESVSAWYKHWVAEGFEALEESARQFSADGRYLYGDRLTLADVCLVPQWYNARRFRCDLRPYTTLASICAWLECLPVFASANPDVQPDAEANK